MIRRACDLQRALARARAVRAGAPDPQHDGGPDPGHRRGAAVRRALAPGLMTGAALGEHRRRRSGADDHGPGPQRRRLVAHRAGAVAIAARDHVRQPRGGAVARAPAQLHDRGDGGRRRLGARRRRRRAGPRVRLLARRHGRPAARPSPPRATALARPGSHASGRAACGAAERGGDRVLPPPREHDGQGRRARVGAVQLRAALPARALGPDRRGHPPPAGPSVPGAGVPRADRRRHAAQHVPAAEAHRGADARSSTGARIA